MLYPLPLNLLSTKSGETHAQRGAVQPDDGRTCGTSSRSLPTARFQPSESRTTLLHEMTRRAPDTTAPYYGLATLCIGVGQGVSTVVEWIKA